MSEETVRAYHLRWSKGDFPELSNEGFHATNDEEAKLKAANILKRHGKDVGTLEHIAEPVGNRPAVFNDLGPIKAAP